MSNFWLFLQLDEQTLISELSSEKNKANLLAFASNF
jgi:hypothetical protein